ncbi:MAG: hypothetical protein ACE5NC_01915 [Anaerolineae bacterium]
MARKLRERVRRERGQSLVVLAFGFVAITAFVGLAADTLLVIVAQARLVRAVDAASLAAASIYREGATIPEMKAMAVQFVSLNGADPASTRLATCEGDDPSGWYSGTLCPGADNRRKVLVRAQIPVGMAFLRLLGFRTVVLTAEATGEAASLDIMIALDRSESMARDTDLGTPGPDVCGAGPPIYDHDCDGMKDSDPQECNPSDACQPFRQVKDAAMGFVDFLNPTFDRVAVVFFDQEAQPGLTPMTADLTAARNVINNMNVYSPPPCITFPPDPSPCPSTNVGGGLLLSNNELTAGPLPRDDALWIVVLLTDGAANTTNRLGGGPHRWANVHCPPATWAPPFCRDWDATTRHPGPGQPGYDINVYDADDWARDSADFVAGNQIVIFTIGLGDLLTNNTSGGTPDGGEQLLRYIAAVGDDGDASTDPCVGEPIGTNCGNYYFSPTAAQLGDIFSEIAERVLTRLVS